MTEMTIVQAVNHALAVAMEEDDKVILLGEDIGKNGGVFRVTEGLQKKYGEKRVVDTPISESGIIGAAIGLAMNGLKPVAEIQFMPFLYPAIDQLASQASRIRFRSAGQYTAPMVVRAPYGGGIRPPELHSDSIENLLIHSPGLKIVMPSTPYDAKGLLLSAIDDPDPVLFFEPLKLYRAFKMEVPLIPYRIPLGKSKILRKGEDLTLITWGALTHLAKKVADEMINQESVSIEVIDLRTLTPLDLETIIQSVEKTGRAIVMHEAVKTGGFGGEVAALIQEHAFYSLESPVLRVTGYDTPFPLPQIEDLWMPNAIRLKREIKKALSF